MNLFGVITTSSVDDTVAALRSFFACTAPADIDRVVLVDSDGGFVLPADLRERPIAVVRTDGSLGFANHANMLLDEARERGADLFLFTSDVVFAPQWLTPLLANRPGLVSATVGTVNARPSTEEAAATAAKHRSTHLGYERVASVDIMCVRIPRFVYEAVGAFDDTLDGYAAVGCDYGYRACLAGFAIELARASYILRVERTVASPDPAVFENKWGSALTYAFTHDDWRLFSTDEEMAVAIRGRQFKLVLERLRAQPSLEPFLARWRRARFAAVCCVYDDDRWLAPTVESVYDACDSIWFLVSDRPWHGEASEQDDLLRRIGALPDPSDKIRLVRGCWADEASQRNEGLRLLAQEGIEYCFVLDADEIYDPAQLADAMTMVRRAPEVDCWRMGWYTYWKSHRYRVDPPDPSRPVVFARVRDVQFVSAREVSARRQQSIPIETATIHHMSYARSDAQIQRKITTFSHAAEVAPGWFDHVWRKWDSDRFIENLNPCWPRLFQRIIEQPVEALPPVLRRVSTEDPRG